MKEDRHNAMKAIIMYATLTVTSSMRCLFKITCTAICLSSIGFLSGCANTVSNEAPVKNDAANSGSSVTSASFIDSAGFKQGKSLFLSDCSACHAEDRTDNLLAGVVQQLGTGYLKLYLTRQDSLIKAGDQNAVKLKKAFGNLGNSHNFNYTDQQLKAIVEYLNSF
jgi:hypothetical protein